MVIDLIYDEAESYQKNNNVHTPMIPNLPNKSQYIMYVVISLLLEALQRHILMLYLDFQ